MIFTTVKLSKKQWHYKMLSFCFGKRNVPEYNFCPYFWLTVFCFIMFPLILIRKLILNLFYFIKNMKYNSSIVDTNKLYIGCLAYCDDFIYENKELVFSDEVKSHNYEYVKYDTEKAINYFLNWKKSDISNYKELMLEILLDRKEKFIIRNNKYNDELKLEHKKVERNIIIKNNLIKVAKYIIRPILIIFGLYSIINVGITLFNISKLYTLDYKLIKDLLIVTCTLTGMFYIGKMFVNLIIKTFSNLLENKIILYIFNKMEKLGEKVLDLYEKVYKILVIGYTMFINWKSVHCPGIDWKEDTEKGM